jgi:hypothetical protein
VLLAPSLLLGINACRLLIPFTRRQLTNCPGPDKDPVSIRNSPFQRLEPIAQRQDGGGLIDGLNMNSSQRTTVSYVPVGVLLHVHVQPDLEPGFGVDKNDTMVMYAIVDFDIQSA